ncbi:tetratricopeptide repeat protein [Pedobacter sp. FW305-3-2-15-E-R2A2]|jgi:tetratricopeptide (TPR) repeat protein|uniref:tetratricopeptide repeat protein n=1 Tax=Pedobacter sp. FW305-3-2-15-E-R2A2 TaxID=3140251 RepID=UPI0031407D96
MINSIRSKQAILIGAVVLLIAFLFTRDIKGLVKPKEQTSSTPAGGQMAAQAPATAEINLEEVSTAAKNMIKAPLAAEITTLETAYKSASESDKAKEAKLLAKKWDDLEQSVPSALYLEIVANKEQTLNNWLTAGDTFMKAFDNTRDSLLQPALLQKANASYSSAMKIDSNSNDAKTGLGITIVNGMGAPMSGIAMLMDVVKKDPKNLKANMSLGTFAMKSGQFDKAIIRFKSIIAMKPSPDAYFYLGTSYENLGKNTEAIDAYEKSKKLAANATLSKFIDDKVIALKNKN